MKSRGHDPLRLDVAAFAAEAARLQGEWPAARLPRWCEAQTPPHDAVPRAVAWSVAGEKRPVAGAEPELWLALSLRTGAWLTCQRCLQPFEQPLAVDARVQFVRGEGEAEALDAECEHDVLALPRWLDVATLAEDELLLALPLVPRHDECPQPLRPRESPGAEAEAPAENPFAVLAGLKGAAGR